MRSASRIRRKRDAVVDASGISSQLELRPAIDADLGAVNAEGFFGSKGLQKLPVVQPDRDYPHRFWLELTQHRVAGECS